MSDHRTTNDVFHYAVYDALSRSLSVWFDPRRKSVRRPSRLSCCDAVLFRVFDLCMFDGCVCVFAGMLVVASSLLPVCVNVPIRDVSKLEWRLLHETGLKCLPLTTGARFTLAILLVVKSLFFSAAKRVVKQLISFFFVCYCFCVVFVYFVVVHTTINGWSWTINSLYRDSR